MKIVIIGTIYPYRGGLADFNERLANEFIAEGHEVKIHNFKLQYPNLLFPGKTQYDPENRQTHLNIERSVNSISPLNWFKTGNKIKNEKPDLVIVRFWIPFIGPSLGFILRQIKKNKYSKIIAITDNVIPHEKRIGDKTLTTYFIEAADAFIAMSKKVQQDLKKFNDRKPNIFAAHPIYDNFGRQISRLDSLNYLGLDKSFHYILFFGLIRDYKGLDILLKAFRKVVDKRHKIKLLIAGEVYSGESEYIQLIDKLDLNKSVIFKNEFIPNAQVKYYFGASNLVVQPYKTATQSGITQIAYHFEKPMIVTDVGGLKETCPDGKVGYVTPVDPEVIAEKIIQFFSNPSIEPKMIENIKEEKTKYSWSTLTGKIEKLYSDIKTSNKTSPFL